MKNGIKTRMAHGIRWNGMRATAFDRSNISARTIRSHGVVWLIGPGITYRKIKVDV